LSIITGFLLVDPVGSKALAGEGRRGWSLGERLENSRPSFGKTPLDCRKSFPVHVFMVRNLLDLSPLL
jgi:hypothetical protein